MDSIISTFHIDWKIIVAQLINFWIVILALYFFAVKPLKKLMDERAKTIEEGLKDARQNADILQSSEKEYLETIAKARREAVALFQEGKKEAEAKRAEMIEDAKKEVGVIVANGKKTLEIEKIKMVAEAKKEIVALIVDATKKLLEGEASSALEKKAVDVVNTLS